jgi:hypothetical protein
MTRYDHLRLVRLPERLERRKTGGGGRPPDRDPARHSERLRTELDEAVAIQQQRRQPDYVNPSLILRVQMTGALLEEEWERVGLTVLSSDADRTLVLFASTDDMVEFRQRLDAYSQGAPEGKKNPAYAAFVATIAAIGAVEPRDRIGVRLREDGFNDLSDFVADAEMLLDLELWDLGRRELRERKLVQIAEYVTSRGGQVVDQYVGPSITMLRVRVTGALAQTLLTVEDIASLDSPPEPDIVTGEALELVLEQLPEMNALGGDAPVIGIIDSGVNAHPLIEDILVGAVGIPADLGIADDWGHGTRVGGVAVFGDLRAQLGNGNLQRGARLCSAKVVNEHGRFDDRRLVPSQMREAISTLHERFGCRIFVIALGDSKQPYRGGKVGTWAATLDEIARELDVVIVVAAGNRYPRIGSRLEQAVTDYPNYLMEDVNRFFEPAGALNVVTVGALANGEGIDAALGQHLQIRPITRSLEPSPFTRIGPSVGGAIKPDLVDFGGTMILDPAVQRLRSGDDVAAAGIMTLHHQPVDQLFTAGSGTSYATPLVAFKAAQILSLLPMASANLIRALLAGAADIPAPARERLAGLGDEAVRAICGHGYVDLERAAYSDDARVVLYAQDELVVDHFAVYEIPIPELFQSEAGRRTIRISLAYDPPVRHTRADYAGLGMSFRLVRGCEPDLIFEHFRRRDAAEGRFPEIAKRYNCDLLPGPQLREKATLQTASVSFMRDITGYGDRYHLIVRCEGGWASSFIDRQRFAVAVQLEHEAEIQLYQRVRIRLNA